MLNIIDLEKRWFRYKIKSYIPHATIVMSLIVITIVAFVVLNSKETSKKEVAAKKTAPIKIAEKIISTDNKVASKIVLTPKMRTVKEEVPPITTTKLEPSLSFINDMQNSSLPYYQPNTYKKSKPNTIKQAPPKIDKKKIITQTIIIEEPVAKKEEIVQKESEVIKTERIIINRKETKDDIKNVIKRFKVNNNPALSLFVAKKYYEIGNYHQSYNYALITNQINKDIESSWIIFAKSLVKLGKKEKALNTLKEYINVSDSHTARLLSEEIQSGSFR